MESEIRIDSQKRLEKLPRTQPCVSRIPREECSIWPIEFFLACSAAVWTGSAMRLNADSWWENCTKFCIKECKTIIESQKQRVYHCWRTVRRRKINQSCGANGLLIWSVVFYIDFNSTIFYGTTAVQRRL